MRDKAVVVNIDEKCEVVTVVPLITDACISCTSPCAKRGTPFTVANKNHLEIKKGSLVKIGASKIQQGIQGIIALLFPILSAIGGYFLSPAIFKENATEGKSAAFVLLFLLLSCLIVFLFSRSNKKLTKSEILEVY